MRKQITLDGIFISEEPKIHGNTKQYVYDDFFDEIDAAEKAWMLGWIVTDGHIRKNMNMVVFGLQRADKKILERISKLFPGTRVIDYEVTVKGKTYKCSKLSIPSRRIKDRLIELGIKSGKKAYECIVPKGIPEYLIHHFWRGALEGDGCFFLYDNKYPRFKITGSHAICKDFSRYLMQYFGIKSSFGADKKSFQTQKQISDPKFWRKFNSLLYDDYTLKNKLYLYRKYDKVQEFIKITRVKSEN